MALTKNPDWTNYPIEIDGVLYPDARIQEINTRHEEVATWASPYRQYVTMPSEWKIRVGRSVVECSPEYYMMDTEDKVLRLYGVHRSYPMLTPAQRAFAVHRGIDPEKARFTMNIDAYGPEFDAFQAGYEAAATERDVRIAALEERIAAMDRDEYDYDDSSDEDEDEDSNDRVVNALESRVTALEEMLQGVFGQLKRQGLIQ